MRIALLCLVTCSSLLQIGRCADISAPEQETVFFAFDDQSIPWRDNLQLTMVPAEKYPHNPVLRRGPEGSPDYGEAVLYGSVIRVGDTFRMWYVGAPNRALPRENLQPYWRPMCYAESEDGIHWDKAGNWAWSSSMETAATTSAGLIRPIPP